MANNKILDELQDILDDDGEIPARTSNRLVLAAVRENYRLAIDLKNEVEKLKLRASFWGAAAGLLSTLGIVVLAVLLDVL